MVFNGILQWQPIMMCYLPKGSSLYSLKAFSKIIQTSVSQPQSHYFFLTRKPVKFKLILDYYSFFYNFLQKENKNKTLSSVMHWKGCVNFLFKWHNYKHNSQLTVLRQQDWKGRSVSFQKLQGRFLYLSETTGKVCVIYQKRNDGPINYHTRNWTQQCLRQRPNRCLFSFFYLYPSPLSSD